MKKHIPYMSLPSNLQGRSSWSKKLQIYLKLRFCEYVKFGAILRKFEILSKTSNVCKGTMKEDESPAPQPKHDYDDDKHHLTKS